MAVIELYHPGPKAAEFAREAETMDLPKMREQIRFDLLALNQKDELLNQSDRDVKDRLEGAKVLLYALKKRYPDDPDILLFNNVYEDLKGDLDRGDETDIDTSYNTILSQMGQAIEHAGVKKESPVETKVLSDVVAQLKALNIQPDYVVTTGNPNAKTVVLFMQVHPNPGITKELADRDGITASQDQIGEAISKAVDSGFVRDIYEEGVSVYDDLEVDEISENPVIEFDASLKAKMKYGDRIRLLGYESENLNPSYIGEVLKLAIQMKKGELSEETATSEQLALIKKANPFLSARMTSMNVYLASNISQRLESEGQPVSFMELGGAHEKLSALGEHPLPISQALAYYGFNVVVVDAMYSHLSSDMAAQLATMGQKFSTTSQSKTR